MRLSDNVIIHIEHTGIANQISKPGKKQPRKKVAENKGQLVFQPEEIAKKVAHVIFSHLHRSS